jgi:hypothetical protein
MASGMRSSNAGVVVLSCSDPRLNPYTILGLDATLSQLSVLVDRTSRLIHSQKQRWFEMQEVGPLMQ